MSGAQAGGKCHEEFRRGVSAEEIGRIAQMLGGKSVSEAVLRLALAEGDDSYPAGRVLHTLRMVLEAMASGGGVMVTCMNMHRAPAPVSQLAHFSVSGCSLVLHQPPAEVLTAFSALTSEMIGAIMDNGANAKGGSA